MKLLIVTQSVDRNDPNLGFFLRWIEEFAKQCDAVHVLCLRKGTYTLPPNVVVSSLGKESGSSRLTYVLRFYSYIWKNRKAYDAVFVHMNSEYLILGGWLWKLLGKRIGLWHTHKSVSMIAKLGSSFTDVIMTASLESYRRKTSKLRVIGHGIDTEWITPGPRKDDGVFRILSVGRISRVKGYGTLLHAVARSAKDISHIEVLLVGGPLTDDDIRYQDELLREINTLGLKECVHLVGSISHANILPYLHSADVFVNCSKTGSLDKAVLEAMAAGVPVLTSNEGLKSTLGSLGEKLIFLQEKEETLVSCLNMIHSMKTEDRQSLGQALRDIVVQQHSLMRLIPRILGLL